MTKAYVSATFRDLQEHRAAVQRALRRLHVEDVAMEAYVAEDIRPLDRCLTDVAECDIYLGIFAWRYGFVPPGHTQSITELEYEAAVANGKPCLIFLLDEDAPWPPSQMDRGDNLDRIEALRTRLSERYTCSRFRDAEQLSSMVTAAVANELTKSRPKQDVRPDALNRYLTRLRQRYGVLDSDVLVPAENEDYLQIELTSVFVEPSVREAPPPAELPRELTLRLQTEGQHDAFGLPDDIDPANLAHRQEIYRAKPLRRLFDVLGSPDRRQIVLLGDPGAGKSTVARYVALCLATGRRDDRLGALTGHLPLLIELRSYVTLVAEGRCQNFIDYLDLRARTDGLGVEEVALRQHLDAGGPAVVVFDGLDEVLDGRRRGEVTDQIANFAANHPQFRVIVTSRVVGYSQRILTEAGFTHHTLQDLDPTQISRFLATWYRLAIPEHPEEAQSRRTRLLDAMSHSSALRELAGNPLLLTILAIIGKDQPLPLERWRLYDHATTVLVEQWDVKRHLPDRYQGADFLDTADKKELLRRLAYRMQSTDRGLAVNSIPAEELSEVFEQYLVERYQRDRATAREISRAMINQFRERNFILSRYGTHGYGFVHRPFLEFFCADALLSQFQRDRTRSFDDVSGLYRQHWADHSWREVLRLLCGALPPAPAGALISLLTTEVNRPWPPGVFTSPPLNLALAAQCLTEVRTVSAVAEAARTLLRQIVLLLEHGVSLDDRETDRLVEEEILPAARALGPGWPGREDYLSWYRRRGVRVIWSPFSAHAARLAATLATPAERIDDLFDSVLGGIDDSAAAYAMVAGLAEVARIATQAGESAAHQSAAARCRTRLIRQARTDDHAGARTAAVQAVGERFGADPYAEELLLERARIDRYQGVREAVVRALGENLPHRPGVRELVRERLGSDEHPAVRRAAARVVGDRYLGDRELQTQLLGRLRTDPDPELLRICAHVLLERFDAPTAVLDLLTARAVTDPDRRVRRATVRMLGRHFGTQPAVRELLVDRLRQDPDAGVLTVAGQALRELGAARDDELWSTLAQRIDDSPDETVRRAALRMLVGTATPAQALVETLVTVAGHDQDGDVRLIVAEALADRVGAVPEAERALAQLARGDPDGRVRLTAARALVDRVGVGSGVRAVLAPLASDDPDARIRRLATTALAERPTVDDGRRRLLVTLSRHDPDPEVRLTAVRAVAAEGIRHGTYDLLVDRARFDPDGPVFGFALGALLDLPGTELTGAGDDQFEPLTLLLRRLRDDSNAVRLVAVRLLVDRFGAHPEVGAALLDRIREDIDAPVVREAAVRLCQVAGVAAVPVDVLLRRAAPDEEPSVRCAAVTVLGERFGGLPSVRNLLVECAAHDPDVAVRRAALQVLGEQLADHPEVRQLFLDRLADRDWSVRRAAVLAVGRHFGAAPEIRARLATLARDEPDAGARHLAGQALTWLPGADPDHLPDLP